MVVFQEGARAIPYRENPHRAPIYQGGCASPLPRPSGGTGTTTLPHTPTEMDEHVLITLVSEVGQEISPTYDVQALRNSNWKVIWRPSADSKRYVHTWCYRCAFGMVVRPSGLLADRVTHRCPLREGEEDATRLLDRAGPPSTDGPEPDWEEWVISDEGGEEEGEGRKLWLPIRDVP